MGDKIKIGLVEDNPDLIKSLKANLEIFEEIELLFIAQNGKEAIDYIAKYTPQVVLMDINMPLMNGIEATKESTLKYPTIKIIMLTVFDENDKIFESILAGASGYLLKDEKPTKIIEAIEEVLEGGAPMSPPIANKAIQLLKNSVPTKSKEDGAKKFNLSAREMEILFNIAEGLNYQQIADKLFIAPKTVRKHIENIYGKLQVHNKAEAVMIAMKENLI